MRSRLMTARILWIALFGSTLMLFGMLFVLKNEHPEPVAVLPLALGAVSMMTAVMSYVLPAQQAKTAFKRAKLEVTEQADPNASSIIPERDAPKRRVFANVEAADRVAFMTYQTGLILGCALAESIALNGFALGFLGHPLGVFVPFFVMSWALFAVRFPSVERVRGPLEKAKNAVYPA